ncbi:MAG: hypothetical protein E6L01_07405 [Thaumarchaeota archaeon]|nr:MAG: hypothetical protein E6L01_07405 [Nitrososphaerota archaeon]
MNHQLILTKKYLNIFRTVVIVLSVIALTAELLPEVEAKAIVVPALILAITISCFEVIKASRNSYKGSCRL